MKHRLKHFLSILILVIATYFLVTGDPILLAPIYPGSGIPLGNIITWFGLIALPLSLYYGFPVLRKPNSQFTFALHNLLRFSIGLAISWFVVSFLLAGNLTFTFTEAPHFQGGQQAMRIFWIFTGLLVILPICILILLGGNYVFKYIYKEKESH